MKKSTENIIRIESLSAFLQLLGTDPAVRTYYRGEPDQFPLLPKLLRPSVQKMLQRYYRGNRDDPVEVQELLMRRFRRYSAHYNRGEKDRFLSMKIRHLHSGFASHSITIYQHYF